jgi:hypothetical protein
MNDKLVFRTEEDRDFIFFWIEVGTRIITKLKISATYHRNLRGLKMAEIICGTIELEATKKGKCL